ncbi:MAG TPA: alanine racemase, partial [Actinomycetes bacterium]|nr:alanine racemase [Actinomycetes bacterium]
MSVDARRAELEANLAAVRVRVDLACGAAGRDPGEVTVIAVTKTFPASDIRLLAELGVVDIGENRDQEAAPKAAACADLSLVWHFVGQLQTNKCKSVARYTHLVHSIDRPKLVAALSRAAAVTGRDIGCLVQVDLGGDGRGPVAGEDGLEARGGAWPDAIPSLADSVAAADGLHLAGVMAIAPLDRPAAVAFERLAEVAAAVRQDHPHATVISAGM